MKLFKVSIVTPERLVWEGEVESLVAPSALGYLGVLANHAPLLSALGKGKLSLKMSNQETIQYKLEGGFMEVLNNQVTFLADYAHNI